MAQYNELPVYKAAYDMLLHVFNMVHNLSREYKYSLGEKLKNEATDLLTNIYRANRVRQKSTHIENARENLEIVRLYVRILKDTRQTGINKHIALNEKLENISKQLAGWHKASDE